ncbi:HCNGP-like protein-domain-containing protein [Colletotrichum phormii]|uniref:HCNGP-like protein-domain-containing protein n=1 Tax=Colletotrichum phormii TaxID=359342 RepID=A0AAI9ZTD6_9PEZI|nr:HCNGP-like protein-domain-containing protein [Colletotrichum phormii]KAK1636648.1 HCNGP-like protein-domain-containing protein [Colletotrichum phormii]
MGGLVAYASSDEDEEVEDVKTEVAEKPTSSKDQTDSNEVKPPSPRPAAAAAPQQPTEPQPSTEAITIGPVQQHSVPLGPSLPPMDTQLPNLPSGEGQSQPPASPYTASRALLRDLTLPPVPNFDIPPSPPGSPPPALSAKFTQFLDLKKKGVHFNAKLAQSAALRNPSLTDKLMSFVELDGRAGYATTLPSELGWDPTSEELLPEWAGRTALRQSQDKVRGAGARKGGGPVEFVPAAAGAADSASPATAGIEQGGIVSRGGKRKAGAL